MARKTPSLLTALHESLRDAQLDRRTNAATALAKAYAAHLDATEGTDERGKALADLGPRYLASLAALGLTTARPAAGAAAPPPSPPASATAASSSSTTQPPDGPRPAGDPASTLTMLRDRAKRRGGGAAPA